MARIKILDPTAPPPEVSADPGPRAGPLAGRRLGIRHDPTWRSFEWVMDEWQRAFERDRARVETWSAGNRSGEEGRKTQRQLDRFADDVEVAVLGLGN